MSTKSRYFYTTVFLLCIPVIAVNAGDDIVTEIHRLEAELNSAFNSYDAEALDRLWGDELTFVTLSGAVADKAQRLSGLKSPPAIIPQSTIESVDVKVYGEIAVAVVLSRWSSVIDGRPAATYYRATHVWAMQTDGWKLVAAQVNRTKD